MSVTTQEKSSRTGPTGAARSYFELAIKRLAELASAETAKIEQAAELCAQRIADGGLVFMFGSGHSAMMCEEMMPRQGCFPGFVSIVETALKDHSGVIGHNGLRAPLHLEKCEGYAEEILKSYRFGPNDAMLIVSTSGIRPLIVEMAMGAKERGMPVIGIVSDEHCSTSTPGHKSGKKLSDLADVVLDNHAPVGDCVLELEGLTWRTGPVSTVTGAMLINMLRCETAARLIRRGVKLELLPSHQFVGDASVEEQLERFYETYRVSLRHLYE